MSNQPPYGYDPQQPYGPGQTGNYGSGANQGPYQQPGYQQSGYQQPEYPPPPPEQPQQQAYPPPPQYGQPGPYSQPYGQPPYGQPGYGAAAYGMPGAMPVQDQKAGFAIASLVLGILSLVLACATVCDAPFFVLGLIFGYLGLQSTTRRNLAVAGLVTSVLGLLLAIGLLALSALSGNFHYYYTPGS